MAQKELYSTKVHAQSRTCFFDVKRSEEGTLYLKISETRSKNGAVGDSPSRIMIFAENGYLDEFRAAFNECAAFVRGAQNQEETISSDRMAPTKARFPNAYAPWTPALDAELWRRYSECETMDELAAHFGRQKSAIRSRLEKLKLRFVSSNEE